MEKILEELSQVSGVSGCFIAGKDGLLIAQVGDIKGDLDFLAASFADIFINLENLSKEKLSQGSLHLVGLEQEDGKVFLEGINESTFLVVFTSSKVNLGLIRYEIRLASEKLKSEL